MNIKKNRGIIILLAFSIPDAIPYIIMTKVIIRTITCHPTLPKDDDTLPKVPANSSTPAAAMKFVKANPEKKAIITSLDKAIDALEGKTGTVITFA